MIASDQPGCFPDNVIVKVSSKDNGSMLDRASGTHDSVYVARRAAFCKVAGTNYDNAVYQRIVYQNGRTYGLVAEVDTASVTQVTAEIVADALYTTCKNVALFLPVADCIATVFYDPVRQALAIAHLGRHSTYAKLAGRVVRHFVNDGSKPADLLVWMGPHAQRTSYKMKWFDKSDDPDWQGFYEQKDDGVYLDLAGFNARLMELQGVSAANIVVSPVDTVTNAKYFSHQAGDTAGRIAVVAMMAT